ncbi:TPA: hypothetical protein ACGTF4_003498 [Shigella sonnei]
MKAIFVLKALWRTS